MKATIAMAAAAMAFAGASAQAGEDSTDRWGAGGTGLPYYATNCGLHNFQGPTDDVNAQRPCGYAGSQQDVAAKRTTATGSAAAGRTQQPQPPLPPYNWKEEEKDR